MNCPLTHSPMGHSYFHWWLPIVVAVVHSNCSHYHPRWASAATDASCRPLRSHGRIPHCRSSTNPNSTPNWVPTIQSVLLDRRIDCTPYFDRTDLPIVSIPDPIRRTVPHPWPRHCTHRPSYGCSDFQRANPTTVQFDQLDWTMAVDYLTMSIRRNWYLYADDHRVYCRPFVLS